MKLLSEEEIMRIFERLDLATEEDRLRMLFGNQKFCTDALESLDESYYLTQLSTRTSITSVED